MKRRNLLTIVSSVALLASTAITVANASTSSASSVSSEVSAAQTFLFKYENPSPTIVLPTFSAKAPKGKVLDFVGCPLSSCLEIQNAAVAGAKKLGWKIRTYEGGLTVTSFLSAMDAVVQNPGNGVMLIGVLPNSAMASQLKALSAKHIPVVESVSISPVGGNVKADFSPPAEIGQSGKVMAAWTIVDSNAKADIAFFWDPIFTSQAPAEKAFMTEMATCTTCTTSAQVTSFTTGVGTTDPGQVVSYLEANPNVNYIAFDIGDDIVGVPQALAAAGLASRVKIETRISDVVNFQDITAGTETMAVTEETSELGWRMDDAMARWFLHDPLSPCCRTPIATIHVITSADLPANVNVPYTVPGYVKDFLKAWRLAK
jgi:hypothetical protein